jgi:uncharacterized repeat protein (TIGR02543 family)
MVVTSDERTVVRERRASKFTTAGQISTRICEDSTVSGVAWQNLSARLLPNGGELPIGVSEYMTTGQVTRDERRLNPPFALFTDVFPIPTREGFVFGGWYSEQGQRVGFGFRLTQHYSSRLFRARWVPAAEHNEIFTATFNANGGEINAFGNTLHLMTVITGADGMFIPGTIPGATKAGHQFNGWVTECGEKVLLPRTSSIDSFGAITENITLYAQWEKIETIITFHTNSAEKIESRPVNEEGKLGELPIPTMEGFNFEGWYTDDYVFNTANWWHESRVRGGMRVTTETRFTGENVNLRARWSSTTHGVYTITVYFTLTNEFATTSTDATGRILNFPDIPPIYTSRGCRTPSWAMQTPRSGFLLEIVTEDTVFTENVFIYPNPCSGCGFCRFHS